MLKNINQNDDNSPAKLYEAVKSGRVKLEDLNDDGKKALRQVMSMKYPNEFKTEAPKPEKNVFQKTVDFINNNPVQRTMDTFLNAGSNAMTFGLSNKLREMSGVDLEQEKANRNTAEKIANVTGEFAGMALPIGGAYKIADKGLKATKLANSSKVLQNTIKGAGVGAMYSTVDEGMNELLYPDEKDFKGHLKEVGINTALGAVLDPAIENLAFPLIKKGFQKTVGKILEQYKAKNITREQLEAQLKDLDTRIQNIQKAEEGQKIVNQNYKPPKPISQIDDELAKQLNDWAGIEGATPLKATKQIEVPNINFNQNVKTPGAYANKQLEDVFNLAKQEKPLPGREIETVENIWGKIAPENAGSLDNLINQSTQPTKVNMKSIMDRLNLGKAAGVDPIENLPKKSLTKQVEINPQPNFTFNNPLVPIKPNDEIAKLTSQKLDLKNQLDNLPTSKLDSFLQKIKPKSSNESVKLSQGKSISNTINHVKSKDTLKQAYGISPLGEVESLSKRAYNRVIDDLYDINTFDKTVEAVSGQKLSPKDKAYMIALNARGSDMVSKSILTENLVNPKGEVIGQSLKSITNKLPKGKLKEFEDYLINKHAITRMGRGEKVFPDSMEMTPEKSIEIVANYELQFPEFKNISDELYEFQNKLTKSWLVDTGIVSEDTFKQWITDNPHYVPNYREFKDIEKSIPTKAKSGYVNQNNPVKKATGSERPILSPIESIIEHTERFIKTAKRNEVGQRILEQIEKYPELGAWGEIIEDSSTMDLKKMLTDEEGLKTLVDELEKPFVKGKTKTDDIVTVLRDGKPVKMKINDIHFLEALTNITPQAQSIVIEAARTATNAMKVLTTGVNPIFSLTRNIFRDIPTSYINSKSTNNPIKFAKDLLGAVVSVIKNDDVYKSYKAIGGGHSSPVAADRNLLAQTKRSILPSDGPIDSTKKGIAKVFNTLENLNNAVETAPRLAEFKRIAKEGDYDSKVKGLYEANDITVNFKRKGDITKQLDAFIPYLNAAFQGLDKMGRVYKDNPIQAGIKSFVALTIPTVFLYMINKDNPEYQKVANFHKDSSLLIPTGEGTFLKIAKPRETGVVFSSLVERLLRQWEQEDPGAFNDFGDYVKNAFAPPGRTIAAPFNDIRANKDWMGRPIVPGDLEKLSPKYQYDNRTSEVSKRIGETINMSPKNIDYLIKSYGGIIGELGIPLTTKDTGQGNTEKLMETLKRKVTVDPVFSNDYLKNFYDLKNKLDTATQDYKFTGQQQEGQNEALRKYFSNVSSDISTIRKEIKNVQNSNLSIEEQNEKIKKLQEMINQISKKAVDAANHR